MTNKIYYGLEYREKEAGKRCIVVYKTKEEIEEQERNLQDDSSIKDKAYKVLENIPSWHIIRYIEYNKNKSEYYIKDKQELIKIIKIKGSKL